MIGESNAINGTVNCMSIHKLKIDNRILYHSSLFHHIDADFCTVIYQIEINSMIDWMSGDWK